MAYDVNELYIGNDNCCECKKPLGARRYNATFESFKHDPDKDKQMYNDYRNLSFCDVVCCAAYMNKILS